MTKKFDIITNEGFTVVVDTELTINPRKGDWVYEPDNTIPIYQFSYDIDQYPIRKVVGTIGKTVEGLPLVVLPKQEVNLNKLCQDLVMKVDPKGDNNKMYNLFFKEGYKAAQQRGTYTEENFENFVLYLSSAISVLEEDGPITYDIIEELKDKFLQSLQPKRFPVSVELSIVDGLNGQKHLRQDANFNIHPVNVFYDTE